MTGSAQISLARGRGDRGLSSSSLVSGCRDLSPAAGAHASAKAVLPVGTPRPAGRGFSPLSCLRLMGAAMSAVLPLGRRVELCDGAQSAACPLSQGSQRCGPALFLSPKGLLRAGSRPASQLAGALCLGAFLASAAHGETCSFGGFERDTRATILPHDAAFAEVQITNTLTARLRAVCALTLFGVTVEVEYLQRPGTLPDDFIVTVPPGFRADPPEITIDDLDSDSVLIWLDEGVGS